MASPTERTPRRVIHPLHAMILASSFPLFLGGLLSDMAYRSTYQIQWSNFAAWLIAGAMVFAGLALLWSLVDLIRADRRMGRPLFYFLLMLAICVLGLINSFVHARDAWAVMPDGFVLSLIVVILSLAAIWVGFSSLRSGATR